VEGLMTDEADEAIVSRLQLVANSLRRAEPAVAYDLEAAIRFKQASPEGRELMRARDPTSKILTLIARLESRADRAVRENQSPLAKDLQDAVELIRGL
jgi:hypothetical protein